MERTVWSDAIYATAMLMVIASLAFSSICVMRPLQTACLAKQIAPTAFGGFQHGLRVILRMEGNSSEPESHSSTNDICEHVNFL